MELFGSKRFFFLTKKLVGKNPERRDVYGTNQCK